MSERFIKLYPGDELNWLMIHHPNAFILLSLIAMRARRVKGQPDGLIIGDALIGSTDLYPGMSRQNFRTALDKLVEFGYVKIVSNGKRFFEREKSTIKVTIIGTLVNLCKSTIYDINPEEGNQLSNQRVTNDQPTTNHEQEGIRKNKNEKDHHPQTPSKRRGRMTDDFSSQNEPEEKLIDVCPGVSMSPKDLEACIAIKGDLEKVREAVAFIQASKKRKHPIVDWPNALARWKIENKTQVRVEDHVAHAEKLCQEFSDFSSNRQWRCSMYLDRKKDQKGLLFESENPYQESCFIPLVEVEFLEKCENFINAKKMRVI